jgi:chorismate synthase
VSSIFGEIFRVSTWGESHGAGVGVVVDGCPAGLEITEEEIQVELNKRRPGQNKLVTPRNEKDQVKILSGIFEGKTTGTPISMAIFNEDQRSHDYGDMVKMYRPSHADLSYDQKYGFRDYRGGGRSSARETAGRVAAGAIAKKLLASRGVEILAWVDGVHDLEAQIAPRSVTVKKIEESPVRCPDPEMSAKMEERILEIKKAQESVGGRVAFTIRNCPAGLGEPVFHRMESMLALAMMSLPATKGFEIGSGFAGSKMKGSEHNDEIFMEGERFRTRTNNAGGVLGGITNGEDINCRVAFKPTATISQSQKTAGNDGKEGVLAAKGRHDPCVVPRAPVIVESMAALVVLDLLMQQESKASFF